MALQELHPECADVAAECDDDTVTLLELVLPDVIRSSSDVQYSVLLRCYNEQQCFWSVRRAASVTKMAVVSDQTYMRRGAYLAQARDQKDNFGFTVLRSFYDPSRSTSKLKRN